MPSHLTLNLFEEANADVCPILQVEKMGDSETLISNFQGHTAKNQDLYQDAQAQALGGDIDLVP